MNPALIGLLLSFVEKAARHAFGDKTKIDSLTRAMHNLLSEDGPQKDQLLQEIQRTQASITRTEASHRNIFIAGWRPMAGWACSLGVFWMFVGEPILRALLTAIGVDIVLPILPEDRLFELLFALLGMAGIRSFDKLKGLSK